MTEQTVTGDALSPQEAFDVIEDNHDACICAVRGEKQVDGHVTYIRVDPETEQGYIVSTVVPFLRERRTFVVSDRDKLEKEVTNSDTAGVVEDAEKVSVF